MTLTEVQKEKVIVYVTRRMTEDGIPPIEITKVIVWMAENPLPTKEEYQAQLATWEAEDKAAKIVALQAELNKLQGS
jgi:hypothetical protein